MAKNKGQKRGRKPYAETPQKKKVADKLKQWYNDGIIDSAMTRAILEDEELGIATRPTINHYVKEGRIYNLDLGIALMNFIDNKISKNTELINTDN